jgi:hypothetical protein
MPSADRPPEHPAHGPVRRLRRPRVSQNARTIFRLRVSPTAGSVCPYSRSENRSANFGERARATSLERTRARSNAVPLDTYRRLYVRVLSRSITFRDPLDYLLAGPGMSRAGSSPRLACASAHDSRRAAHAAAVSLSMVFLRRPWSSFAMRRGSSRLPARR